MIRQLDPIVASRIAAGEVVERPSSVLRELIDNSIDAGASKISVYVDQGGIRSLTVVDNGCGMAKEDLPLACISHATSKISTLDDLFNLRTLGFRGEALSSIAACSLLTIDSNGNRIIVDNGHQSDILSGSVSQGTSVRMENLFEMIPARKLFLRRPQTEATECRKVFLEKALGFEKVEFLFFVDGELKIHLAGAPKQKRCVDVMSMDRSFQPAQILEMDYTCDNASLYAVASDPSCYKRDRTQVRIFVNGRVIDSFALVQAVTNAYSAALPGGAFPFFYLFIEDNPSLVDFNIHPAKRECKIRNQSQIYGCVTAMIRNALLHGVFSNGSASLDEQPEPPTLLDSNDLASNKFSSTRVESRTKASFVKEESPFKYGEVPSSSKVSHHTPPKTTAATRPESKPFNPSWFENARAIMDASRQAQRQKEDGPKESGYGKALSSCETLGKKQATQQSNYKYIGQLFDTFLLVELGDRLLFIDQHAAHERILYDEIVAQKDVQRLIVPYQFETDRSADDFLLENSIIYADFGVELTRVEPMLWEMSTIPAVCRKNEADIAAYIQNTTGDVDSARKGLFAIMACHAAIKAGDPLDSVTAKALVDKAFKLDAMVCPHGRSFTFEMSKEELYRKVGRIV